VRADWDQLTEESQLVLSREALRHASAIIAEQAELLATGFETGRLEDRGGADALRLLAAIVQLNGDPAELAVAGHALNRLAQSRGFAARANIASDYVAP
jgi:hypothetical protein